MQGCSPSATRPQIDSDTDHQHAACPSGSDRRRIKCLRLGGAQGVTGAEAPTLLTLCSPDRPIRPGTARDNHPSGGEVMALVERFVRSQTNNGARTTHNPEAPLGHVWGMKQGTAKDNRGAPSGQLGSGLDQRRRLGAAAFARACRVCMACKGSGSRIRVQQDHAATTRSVRVAGEVPVDRGPADPKGLGDRRHRVLPRAVHLFGHLELVTSQHRRPAAVAATGPGGG